jgi:glycosyltransferase involved in cell wall biosynthesis
MNARRAWLVNPFDPVPGSGLRPMRYEAFARALLEAGWDVVWLTADFDHTSRAYRVPRGTDRVVVEPGFRVEYVHVPPYRRTVGAARLRSHRVWVQGLADRMAAAIGVPDVVLVSVPLLGALRAVLAWRQGTVAAVVADVQDTWPEALDMLLPAPARVPYRPLRALAVARERRRLAACDAVIAVSETYLAQRRVPDVPSLCAYLGVDVPPLAARVRPSGQPLTLLWNGTIRPAADLATVVDAAALLRRRGVAARFVIAGDGPPRAALEARAARRGLGPDTIRFLGAYPEHERAAIVAGSDVGLHAYVPGAAISLTNKFFDYQAAGLALLNGLPGEAARLIERHAMGVSYRAGDAASLAAAVAVLERDRARTAAMGMAARRFAERHGSRAAVARDVAAFLGDVAGGVRAVA